MFCPKCGTENPDTGKFCRSCGTDLEGISAVLSGRSTANAIAMSEDHPNRKAFRRHDPTQVFGDAVRNGLMGVGFVIIALVLFFTNAANGQTWWWAMLFPGLILLAMGGADVIKYGMMKRDQRELNHQSQNSLDQPASNVSLPPSSTAYVTPEIGRQTRDLAPPSVTDGTTRLLEINANDESATSSKHD